MPTSNVRRAFSAMLVIALLATVYATSVVAQETLWPTEGWAASTPEAQGLDGAPFSTLDGEIKEGKYGYIDRMVVMRNGELGDVDIRFAIGKQRLVPDDDPLVAAARAVKTCFGD